MTLKRILLTIACATATQVVIAQATEPNESFATATILAPGVVSVADSLTPGTLTRPDTFLGIRNGSGTITLTDDDSSVFGDGRASGLMVVPTNSGAIRFAVTGKGDLTFNGSHSQEGIYDVVIDVFDSGGSPVTTFSTGVATLHSGMVNEFFFPAIPSWNGGTYNINIDNGLADPSGGDVDFFTFTDLDPGRVFTAQTYHPTSGLNTYLYQYNASGSIVAIDDESGIGDFSLLRGTVPANGKLTFAVTGFGDAFVEGAHTQSGAYNLSVDLRWADFNSDGVVNSADLGVWQVSYNKNAGADADHDGDSDGDDFLVWQRQFGMQFAAPSTSIAAVPEPGSSALVCCFLAAYWARRPTR